MLKVFDFSGEWLKIGIYVNTNVTALRGQNYLQNVNNSLNTTYQRLSSGLRINSAKDDAAGLQIADRLTTQINGLNQGNRNTNDGIALAQTIEGGLDEIGNMLQRMRTLAVQAANGTNTSEDRHALESEVNDLVAEINRIACQTTFGGKKVLWGADTQASSAGVDTIYSNSGATNHTTSGEITFQVGANSGDSIKLTVESFTFSAMVTNASSRPNFGNSAGASPNANGLKSNMVGGNQLGFNFTIACYASNAISTIDKLIAQVDQQRSTLGSIQNRLESAIKVQSNVSTNTADARSRIRDTDFAEESANLSQQSIIQQAATSMLMQANARPQLGLSLLG